MKKIKKIIGVSAVVMTLMAGSVDVFAKCYNPCGPTQVQLHKYKEGTNAQGLPTLTLMPGCC